MKSWKTTLCGVLAIIGGGLTQFFHDIPWLFKLGGFLATTAPAVGLLFARDNGVSSEALGIVPSNASPKSGGGGTLPLALATALLGALAIGQVSGCAHAPVTASARTWLTMKQTQIAVDKAMKVYASGVVTGKVSTEQQAVIDKAHTEYRAAYRLAVQAISADPNAFTPDDVAKLADRLETLIASLPL